MAEVTVSEVLRPRHVRIKGTVGGQELEFILNLEELTDEEIQQEMRERSVQCDDLHLNDCSEHDFMQEAESRGLSLTDEDESYDLGTTLVARAQLELKQLVTRGALQISPTLREYFWKAHSLDL